MCLWLTDDIPILYLYAKLFIHIACAFDLLRMIFTQCTNFTQIPNKSTAKQGMKGESIDQNHVIKIVIM